MLKRKPPARLIQLQVAFFLLGLSACEKKATTPASPAELLLQRGRTVYSANCTACHNADPKKPGALGPEVFGASAELLEARVVHGNYPAGYTPKRATKIMQPLPQLKGDLDALRAFLNQ